MGGKEKDVKCSKNLFRDIDQSSQWFSLEVPASLFFLSLTYFPLALYYHLRKGRKRKDVSFLVPAIKPPSSSFPPNPSALEDFGDPACLGSQLMRPFHANLAVLLTSVSFSDAYCIDMKTLLTTLSLHDISNVVDLFAFIKWWIFWPNGTKIARSYNYVLKSCEMQMLEAQQACETITIVGAVAFLKGMCWTST